MEKMPSRRNKPLDGYDGEIRLDDDAATLHVDLWYPPTYGGKVPGRPFQVEVELVNVRAANSITIRYDFERDGWSIRMDRTRDDNGCMEVTEREVEVAFVPAWLEDEADEEPQSDTSPRALRGLAQAAQGALTRRPVHPNDRDERWAETAHERLGELIRRLSAL